MPLNSLWMYDFAILNVLGTSGTAQSSCSSTTAKCAHPKLPATNFIHSLYIQSTFILMRACMGDTSLLKNDECVGLHPPPPRQ